MIKYFIKRSILMVVVLIVVITITFFVSRCLPGDPTALWVGDHPTPQQLDMAREQLGLDQPLLKQYYSFIKKLVRGDLGISLRTLQPVTAELGQRFSATFELVTVALVLSCLFGFPLGLLAAMKTDTPYDLFIRGIGYLGLSFPVFWLGMILQIIFFGKLDWLPLQGRYTNHIYLDSQLIFHSGFLLVDSLFSGEWAIFSDAIKHICLPAATMSCAVLGIVLRTSRSAMIDTMAEPHFTTYLTYGFTPGETILRSSYKNTLIPVSTVVGLSYGLLLGGTFLVEAIFDWPGLGQFGVLSILTNDFPAIIGITFLYTASYVVINFFIDIIYVFLDPRVRQ